jgi:hypothetical protein
VVWQLRFLRLEGRSGEIAQLRKKVGVTNKHPRALRKYAQLDQQAANAGRKIGSEMYQAPVLVMNALDKWTETLRCPNCALTGVALLSQPKGPSFEITVDHLPAGFEVVTSQYGDTFYCKACNRAARESVK